MEARKEKLEGDGCGCSAIFFIPIGGIIFGLYFDSVTNYNILTSNKGVYFIYGAILSWAICFLLLKLICYLSCDRICKIRGHNWNRCKCGRCGLVREGHHDFHYSHSICEPYDSTIYVHKCSICGQEIESTVPYWL